LTTTRAYFRAARAGDKTAVLRFTRHTYEHGDYIKMVWRDWLANASGKLLVSTIERRPGALAHVARLSPSESWLEGLRVDPAFRGCGLATGLTCFSLKTAVDLNTTVMRFITSSNNRPVHLLSNRLGFNKITAIQSYLALPVDDHCRSIEPAEPADLGQLLDLVEASPINAEMQGLFGSGWQFMKLERAQMEARLKAGQVLAVRGSNGIEAMAIVEKRLYDKSLVICFAGGSPAALTELLTGLRGLAARYRLRQVAARLPPESEVLPLYTECGFEKSSDENFWIYEKKLKDENRNSK